ncbi:putative oxidoreductase [Rhodotorula toruloides ATCC 204091]|uniref:Putative oxidoreductase n=2 Tax=Rhodotorula toruloides TaxID=5286 RepID=A0A2T0AC67_RHOTO|nr:putative oxidoreductase [Rhodotorula toruloides ATCC 204091]KAK4330908.1 putative oxidoreductase [Rhodotorula toruloides]PRQ75596.1 putative oxidoreductase [Rhodotorula toruloides]
MTATPRILISGAGIAGPVCAHFLGRAGIRTTLVERAPVLRANGQNLDLNGVTACVVVERMGPEVNAAILVARTREEGTYTVDDAGQTRASFPVEGGGFTNEIEIMREKLVGIFYGASRSSTEYIFGDSIAKIEQTDREAVVTFANGTTKAFDVVIVADGMASSTRSLVFGRPGTAEKKDDKADVQIRSVGFHCAYFTLPYVESDGAWSRWWHTTRSRSIWLRPDVTTPSTRAYLLAGGEATQQALSGARKLSVDEQKSRWKALYAGAGWQTDRVLEAMDGAEDFYMQEVAHVISKSWSKGRVVLLGDAAGCPSPMSGMGTSCAVVGAYVLAGELAKRRDALSDGTVVKEALEAYERICRPYFEDAQDIPMSLFRLGFPDSALGVSIQRTAVGAISYLIKTRAAKWAGSKVFGSGETAQKPEDAHIKLPLYDF